MNTEDKKASNMVWSWGEKPDGSLMSLSGPWLLREGKEINDKVKREVSTDQALLYFDKAVMNPQSIVTPFTEKKKKTQPE